MKALLGILVWLGFIGVLFGTLWIYQERDRQHQFALGAGPTREPHSPPALASGTSHSDSRAFESGAGSGAQSSPPHERTLDGSMSNASGGVDLVRGDPIGTGRWGAGDFEVSEERFLSLACSVNRALCLDWEDIPDGFPARYSLSELRKAIGTGHEASIPGPADMLRVLWERDGGTHALFAEHQALFAEQSELVALLDRLKTPKAREGVELLLAGVRDRLDRIRSDIWSAAGDPAYQWLYELDKATR